MKDLYEVGLGVDEKKPTFRQMISVELLVAFLVVEEKCEHLLQMEEVFCH